jgi:nucleoside-diphosphate-sugar epimerase
MSKQPSLVCGATGMVGSRIVRALLAEGTPVVGMSRNPPADTGLAWIRADLLDCAKLDLPPDLDTLYSTVNPNTLAHALPSLKRGALQRVVAISSTSIATKQQSRNEDERRHIQSYAAGETAIVETCARLGLDCTILRPTLIYNEQDDANVCRIAALIQRLHCFPLYGRGRGLRQPVHADDLARGAVLSARSAAAANHIYEVGGADTITYREMVGRIFDGLGKPRAFVPLPPLLWRAAFGLVQSRYPRVHAEMGARMAVDMAFDCGPAAHDFGWQPRSFRPRFDPVATGF